MIRAATRARIEAAHRFSGVYRGSLANHLPMALVALDALGADDARIAEFADRYETRLEPLADGDAFAAELAAVRQAMAREGTLGTVRRELVRLAEAPGSGAFHGLIRLAFALEAGSDAEVAHALAYWRVACERLGDRVAPAGLATPAQVLRDIAADARFKGILPPGRNIAARMQAARAHPAFAGFVASASPRGLSLDALAGAALRAYAASGSFTLLHAVTGCQALRVLQPHLAGEAPLLHAWQAIVAAFIASGAPALDDAPPASGCEWPALHAAAIASDDEHDVKLVYSAWREWQRSGDDLYRHAAAARVRAAIAETT